MRLCRGWKRVFQQGPVASIALISRPADIYPFGSIHEKGETVKTKNRVWGMKKSGGTVMMAGNDVCVEGCLQRLFASTALYRRGAYSAHEALTEYLSLWGSSRKGGNGKSEKQGDRDEKIGIRAVDFPPTVYYAERQHRNVVVTVTEN